MFVCLKKVKLEIFSEKENVDQLEWAMESLKVLHMNMRTHFEVDTSIAVLTVRKYVRQLWLLGHFLIQGSPNCARWYSSWLHDHRLYLQCPPRSRTVVERVARRTRRYSERTS